MTYRVAKRSVPACGRWGWRWFLVGCLLAAWTADAAWAAGPRVLPAGQLPADRRLEPLKDLDGYFPFEPPATRQVWEQRSAEVRRRMLVSTGLWPMPQATPLNPVIHGRLDQGDYTVEKAYFESFPGFFVTGSLYRPKKTSGRVPGVLSPHGHWAQGRFHDAGADGVRKEIEKGAERFENGGRSPLQARCVQLARMGCVVFHYDMLGYADSQQISFEVAHRFAKQRPEMNAAEGWGLFSPQAESHLQSVMGLQTYNSIRALDFLQGLPDVDPERIAVTGASGGGTQTFMLSAIDPRVAVSIPAVMVSTAMQGGCTCENACLLRVGTGNVEFAGLFAPKPLALTGADDWTKEMATKGFPQLQQLYQLLEAPDRVALYPYTQFPHNYNAVSRAAMYEWVNRHFQLGLPTPIVEQDYPRLTAEQLTVWDAEHPRPAGGDDFERGLLRRWHAETQRQLAAAAPQDAARWPAFRELVGGGLEVVIGRSLPAASDVEFHSVAEADQGSWVLVSGLLRNKLQHEELPLIWLKPRQSNGRRVIWLHPDGKSGLLAEDGSPRPLLKPLLEAGCELIGADLIYQGEFLADGQRLEQTRRVKNPRESAAYTFGYNHTVFAQRVHDVLSVIALARGGEPQCRSVSLVGLGPAGSWAAAALAPAGAALDAAAIDTAGFRFGAVRDLHSPEFLPGGARYGDLPGMLALAAGRPLWLAGETADSVYLVSQAYRAVGQEAKFQRFEGPGDEIPQAAARWLLAAANAGQ